MLLSILMSFLLLLPTYINANSEKTGILKMEELAIQIMPEYSYHPKDKKKKLPPLLIGYHGILINQSETPQKGLIEIPLPMTAKGFQIGYVADYNRDQTKMNEIEYEVNKDKQTITWTTSEEIYPGELYKFVIEFYTNQIKAENTKKELTYTFESFTDIGILRVLFLEPLKTESFRLTPAADSHQENGYGMNMFMYQIQGMQQNDKKEISLEYKREETKTTMEIMESMGNKTPAQGEEKKNETLSAGVIIGGVSGITGAIAIVLLIFLKKRSKPRPNMMHVSVDPKVLELKKKRIRGMLIEGKISEKEYNDLLRKLEN